MSDLQQSRQQCNKGPKGPENPGIGAETTQQPQHFTELTHLIDQCQAEARREAEEYARLQKQGLDGIAERMERLQWLESEVDECAEELEKCVEHDRKSESADRHRLEEEERKVMEMAGALSAKQHLDREREDAKRNLVALKKIQANQLAEEIVAEQERVRAAAEQRAHQLLAEEKSAQQQVAELAAELAISRKELSTKSKEMRLAEAAAQKKVDDMAALRLEEQYELDEMDEKLREIRSDAYVADQLVEKRSKEGVDSGLRAWEKRAAVDGEREWAKVLHDKQAISEAVFEQQKEALDESTTALYEAEDVAKRCAKERRELKACAKKCIAAEQEALERARRLAAEQGERRRVAQATVAELTAEEQEARVRAFDLEHRPLSPGEVEDQGSEGVPAVLDIYQHSHYEMGGQQQLEQPKEEKGGVMGRIKSIF